VNTKSKIIEIKLRVQRARKVSLEGPTKSVRLRKLMIELTDCLNQTISVLDAVAPSRREPKTVAKDGKTGLRLSQDWLLTETGTNLQGFREKVLKALSRSKEGLSAGEIKTKIGFPFPDGYPTADNIAERKVYADYFRRNLMDPLVRAGEIRLVGNRRAAVYLIKKKRSKAE